MASLPLPSKQIKVKMVSTSQWNITRQQSFKRRTDEKGWVVWRSHYWGGTGSTTRDMRPPLPVSGIHQLWTEAHSFQRLVADHHDYRCGCGGYDAGGQAFSHPPESLFCNQLLKCPNDGGPAFNLFRRKTVPSLISHWVKQVPRYFIQNLVKK